MKGQPRRGKAICLSCGRDYHIKPVECASPVHTTKYHGYLEDWVREDSKLNKEVLLHYGTKCACVLCDFDDFDFKVGGRRYMQLDHIEGGGKKHHAEIKSSGQGSIFRLLKRQGYPLGYRPLCAACNVSMLPGENICEFHKLRQSSESNKLLAQHDLETLAATYRQSFDLAGRLTQNDPKLFKTVLNCLFWETAHYVFGKKLKAAKP